MKHFYLLILSSLLFLSAIAGDTKRLINSNSDLFTSSSWSPSTPLSDGDILIVPKNYRLVITKEVDLVQKGINKVTLIVEGALDLENGKLTMDAESAIYLASPTATIVTTKGNPADKINIGNSEKYNGSVGAIVGPALADVTTSSSTSTSIKTSSFITPSSSTKAQYEAIIIAAEAASAALPVKFLSFNVSKASNGVSVQWATAEEVNADVFQIERSEDSRTWRSIGTVKAAGNSTNVQNYSFIDKNILNKVAYYRIKEIDIDGKPTYTDVKNVTNSVSSSATNVTIIPTGNNVVVNFTKQVAGTVVVRLISFGGQVLAQQAYTQAPLQIVFSRTYVNKGNYIVSVSNSSDLNVSKQIAL